MPDDMDATPHLVIEAHGTVTPPPNQPEQGDDPDKEHQ